MNLHRSILGLGLALAATAAFAAAPATPATPAKPAATATTVKHVAKHDGKCEQRSKLGHCLKWSDNKPAAPAAAPAAAKKS